MKIKREFSLFSSSEVQGLQANFQHVECEWSLSRRSVEKKQARTRARRRAAGAAAGKSGATAAAGTGAASSARDFLVISRRRLERSNFLIPNFNKIQQEG